MSSYWHDLASSSDGYYQVEDFEAAAYRLVAEQVLYHADRGSKKLYGIVERYERNFAKVLAPLGITLGVDRQLLFAYALPVHVTSTPATVTQTLFALVLRGIYEDGMRAGYLCDESGEIHCGFVELQEKFQLMTGRELPAKAELKALIRTARRWGIVRHLEDIESPYPEIAAGGVAIRPAIREVLGETALQQLALWAGERKDGGSEPDAPVTVERQEGGDSHEEP